MHISFFFSQLFPISICKEHVISIYTGGINKVLLLLFSWLSHDLGLITKSEI